MTTTHQTRSFLLKRFEEAGIRPRTKHGQNFLIDLNLLRVLYDAAEVGPDDVVLEIGTGTGSLTGLLVQTAAEVVTVEIDEQLHQLAKEELADPPNLTMLRTDVLRNKSTFQPEVLQLLKEKQAAAPGRRIKLAANLPYNVATPIISNLLVTDEITPHSMVVTIQKELADRIMAAPSTKDYSALSVWVQSQAQVELVRELPPQVFWPRPNVNSAIIKIVLDLGLRARMLDRGFFHRMMRAVFLHRRKFLRSVVCSAFKRELPKETVDEVLVSLGHGPNARAEAMDVPTLIALANAFWKVAPQAEPLTDER